MEICLSTNEECTIRIKLVQSRILNKNDPYNMKIVAKLMEHKPHKKYSRIIDKRAKACK